MKLEYTMTNLALFAGIALAIGATAAPADEIWAGRDGTLTLKIHREVVDQLGLVIDVVGQPRDASDTGLTLELPLRADDVLRFARLGDGRLEVFSRDMRTLDGLSIVAGDIERIVHDYAVAREGAAADGVDGERTRQLGRLYLELRAVKTGFDARTYGFGLASRELVITLGLANALERPDLVGVSIGRAVVIAEAQWIGGDRPVAIDESPVEEDGAGVIGPDMVYCQLFGLGQYGRLGDIVGLSVGTTSWNIGDAPLPWNAIPNEDHPFIVMDLFRLKTVDGSERFEQVGQSWIKHGFYALDSSQCSTTCQATGPSSLGVGCTDTYGPGLNASQGGLGPRYEVNPWTRGWTYAGSHMQGGGGGHTAISHRIQVHDADLDAPQNPGATYYSSGYYVAPGDVDQMNSAAWKEVTVSGSPGGNWSFGMSGAGTLPIWGQPIDAWNGATQTILAEELPVVEFVSPDGRCVLGSKATDLGGGIWHYEYALMNVDMDRQAGSFSVPVPVGAVVTNVGSHAVEHHDEPFNTKDADAVPINNAPWTSLVSGDAVTWSTTTNPLRWGTLYNFRFDANVDPAGATVTLGLFRTGSPSSVSGIAVAPRPICGNNILEGYEHCDPPGGECDTDCSWLCGDHIAHPPEEPCDDAGESPTCDADCTLVVCGDGTTNASALETCDDGGESATCDDDCTAVACGDGNVNEAAGEACDPPDGVSCDAACHSMGGGGDTCASATVVSAFPYTDAGDTCGATNDYDEVCNYPGSLSPDLVYSFTPNSACTANISLCDSAYDTKLYVYESTCGGANFACNDDSCGVSGWRSELVGVNLTGGNTYYVVVDGYGSDCGTFNINITGDCTFGGGGAADQIRGGKMWDKWWAVNGALAPSGDHPLYPPVGQQSGSDTYRCKECHGWDLKGAAGAYGSGSHYTGIPGVFGSTMTPGEMFNLIKLDGIPNGHGFVNHGLADQDIWDLVEFLQNKILDTDDYIDPAAQFIGDPVAGEFNYTNALPGGFACMACHAADGTGINFGTPQDPVWVGTIAVYNPWELLHKIRFGQPGATMGSWIDLGGTDQGAADIGRYLQLYFPVDCIDGTHCDDGLFCTGTETCADRFCLSGSNPCPPDTNCDEAAQACVPLGDIPTMTEWGAIILTMLLLAAGSVVFGRRRRDQLSPSPRAD